MTMETSMTFSEEDYRALKRTIQRLVKPPERLKDSFAGTGVPLRELGPPEHWDFSVYRRAVCGGAKQGLYFLPDALWFMANNEDGPEITGHVIGFVDCFAGSAAAIGQLDALVGALMGVFWKWLQTVRCIRLYRQRPPHDLLVFFCMKGGDSRDEYLEYLQKSSLTVDGEPVFDRVLSDWVQDRTNPKRSAQFLDLCLRARTPDLADTAIYSASPVLAFAGDKHVCQAHWRICQDLLTADFPEEYVREIRKLL